MKLIINETMKYKKEWFFGGDKKDEDAPGVGDYVSAYVAENGERIEVCYSTNSSKYYTTCGDVFYSLKDAKDYLESHTNI